MRRARARQFIASERGSASIELALLLPVMLMLHFGSSYFAQLLNAKNAVTRAAYAAATMAALEPSINDAQMGSLLAATSAIVQQVSSNYTVTITNLAKQPSGQWGVVWSDSSRPGYARPVGAIYSFSAGDTFGDGTTSRLVVEVIATYDTELAAMWNGLAPGLQLPGTVTVTDSYINTPLQAGNIARVLASGAILQ